SGRETASLCRLRLCTGCKVASGQQGVSGGPDELSGETAMSFTPLAQRLAEYGCGLRFEDLPAAVVHEAKRRFIDSLGTAVGAMNADAYAIARRRALRAQS